VAGYRGGVGTLVGDAARRVVLDRFPSDPGDVEPRGTASLATFAGRRTGCGRGLRRPGRTETGSHVG
jgi:hypothetical protein